MKIYADRNHATNQPMYWSGLVQERLQRGRWWRLGNLLSTARFWLWRANQRSRREA